MRYLHSLLFLLACMPLFSQADYLMEINGKTIEIVLDKEYKLTLEDGKPLVFKVSFKDTLEYNDELFSFKYSKDFKISRTKVEEGIEQIMLMTAEGSGLLIQKYSTISPVLFNELMLSEVTKESINYGFNLKREDYSRTLRSGQTVRVNKAVLTYLDETNIYEVASIGGQDQGILIMTMVMDDTFNVQGKKLIDLMWDSLIYK